MVVRWEMPWIDLHTDERFLRTLTEARWGLTETETGVAPMAENETVEQASDGSSIGVLQSHGYSEAVPVGVIQLLSQMEELEEIIRDAGRRCDDRDPVMANAQKALFRCVDTIKRFNDEYR